MTGKPGMTWERKIIHRQDLNFSISGKTNKRMKKAVKNLGYKDRADFTRRAISEKLDREGVK